MYWQKIWQAYNFSLMAQQLVTLTVEPVDVVSILNQDKYCIFKEGIFDCTGGLVV